MKESNKIYPLTIVADRYGGSYSGALFTAWNLNYDELPDEINDCDLGCGLFWTRANRDEIGFGNDPNAAYQDLLASQRLEGQELCSVLSLRLSWRSTSSCEKAPGDGRDV